MNKIIIWTTEIDSLFLDKGMIGGLTIQMSFWAKTFHKNGWKVYSFSTNKHSIIENIEFLYFPSLKIIGILIEFFLSIKYIIKIKPDCIICRGASRQLSYISLISKITKTRLIFFSASDSDFRRNEELIPSKKDKLLYRYGLKNTKYFVTQNSTQKEYLQNNYKKYSNIIIPNIWILEDKKYENQKPLLGITDYILWVGNFRELKRPQWFIELARINPNQQFVMVGDSHDLKLYSVCKNKSKVIPNLHFLGHRKLEDVNNLFKFAKILVCTSEIEGFPNTFLQAWHYNIPVISTFNPSNILTSMHCGIFTTDFESMNIALEKLNDTNYYEFIQKNIYIYFKGNHNPQICYNEIISLVKFKLS